MLIFVLPPIFTNPSAELAADFSKFNVFSLPCAALALFLFLQDKREEKQLKDQKAGARLWRGLMGAGVFFWTLGFLLVLAALLKALFVALKIQSQGNVVLPTDAAGYAACALSLLAGAFYEECLYRLYLPKALRALASLKAGQAEPQKLAEKKMRAALDFFAEAAAVALFALAHFWQGPWAVLNALLAGIILRVSFVKARGVWPPFLAHLLYNAAALLLS